MAAGDRILVFDPTLTNEFSWAGGVFPFAGTQDITVSGATTWNDSVGYKKVKKLTIAAGQTLTIQKSPFYIFADEIELKSESESSVELSRSDIWILDSPDIGYRERDT